MQHDVFPLEQQEDFFLKDISVIQKYNTAVMHTWSRLPLLLVFGTIFQEYAKIWQFFLSLREFFELRLELIYMMYDKLTLGRLLSWT